MVTREEEKKKWELEQCRLVAGEINKQRGTDYEARPSKAEPADVVLESKSGGNPALPVQVVSIPLDFRHRDDKHSVGKIKETLSQTLQAAGLKHCVVGVILSGEAEMRGIKQSLLDVLVKIILQEAGGGNRTLRYDEIFERSPELSDLVHDILISHHEIIPTVEVDIPAGSSLPLDGQWIEEGIVKKMAKYGGADAVTGLVLVIGVAGFVDDAQIEAFRKANRPDTLPFSQIWIVTPFHGVVCLKL
jgi:hypothetical protein